MGRSLFLDIVSGFPSTAKGGGLLYLLHHDELVVAALGLHELLVGALLHYPTLLEHHYEVGMLYGAEAVGDDEGGAARHEAVERLLHKVFALGVERRGGFVEDEDVGIGEDGTSYGETLPLSAAEEGSAIADVGVVALRCGKDELVRVGYAGGTFHLVEGGGGMAVGDVVADGVVEEVGLLRDDTDVTAIAVEGVAVDGAAIDEYLSGCAPMEAQEEVGQGALARAGAAYQSHRGATRDVERDVVKHFDIGSVAEGDVRKCDEVCEL